MCVNKNRSGVVTTFRGIPTGVHVEHHSKRRQPFLSLLSTRDTQFLVATFSVTFITINHFATYVYITYLRLCSGGCTRSALEIAIGINPHVRAASLRNISIAFCAARALKTKLPFESIAVKKSITDKN